jgi:hypothetical protein
MIAKEMGKEAPRYHVNPVFSGLAWRLEKLRSMLTGVKPIITRETANTSVQKYEYSNKKIKKELNFEFTPIDDTIRHFCGIFLDSHVEQQDN